MLQQDRLNPDQVANYYIPTAAGGVVPASTVVSIKTKAVPESVNHFQQLNSATIQGVFGGTAGRGAEAAAQDRRRDDAAGIHP